MSKTQNTDLAVNETGRMIEATPDLVEQAYAAIIEGELPPEVGDPEVTRRAIQERIKTADSFDDVFAPQSLTPWTQYAGEIVTVYGFHLNPSSFRDGAENGGSAVYAVVEISRTGDVDDAEPVSTGGGNVLLQLVKAWEKGWFPFKATLAVRPGSTPGREVHWIQKAS